MIDIHCHILHEVDDGSRDLIESIGMAKQALNQGITMIFATPHYIQGKYENEAHHIISKVNHLNQMLSDKQIPLKVLPGQEPRLYGELVQDYKAGKILTLNNAHKYILIEFPDSHVPAYTEKLLFHLQLEGIVPIIVHPERNVQIRENPNILYKFVLNGAASQVTASSLYNERDKKKLKFTLKLIENGLVQFIASDSHRLSRGSFKLKQAFDVINNQLSGDLSKLLQDNSQLLLGGKGLIIDSPRQI